MSDEHIGAVTLSLRSVPDIADALRSRGWRVGVVSGATTKAEALDAIGAALSFPRWYGHNLDALWDCLLDLSEPTALVWTGWEPLAVHAPREWSKLVELLTDRAREQPAFAVVFAVPDADAEVPVVRAD